MRDNSKFDLGFKGVRISEWYKNGHLNLLSPNMLKELALIVGYSRVIFNQRNESLSSLNPLEYRPDPKDRPENENIIC
jgi:hypothetical protein